MLGWAGFGLRCGSGDGDGVVLIVMSWREGRSARDGVEQDGVDLGVGACVDEACEFLTLSGEGKKNGMG